MKNKDLKRRIIEISYNLKLSHLGSCLTSIDIIKEIYDRKKLDEKVIISCGHAHVAHLVVMEKCGYVDNAVELIKTYGIHCDIRAGCDVSSGSLGHWGIAVGMALADRDKLVYLVSSDGDCYEGSTYEALNIIRDQKIGNIRIYINDNGFAAYRKSNLSEIFYDKSFINIVETDMTDYPKYLQGQLAHYKVLDKEEYEEVMDLLG